MSQVSDRAEPNKPETVASPCVGVCTIAPDNLCEGCFRSLDEISQWAQMSNQQRRETVSRTWQRAREAGKLL